MSLSYAESLSYFPHKGKVGMPELTEKPNELKEKLEQLVEMVRQSRHTVVITGAGVSTDAGIPDFRGPNGVWTLEKRGEKPSFNIGFEQAKPTLTHRALCILEQNNYVHYVISQNIDGLHHRSGLPLDKLAELHGNVFAEECDVCGTQIIRPTCVGSYCRKRTGNICNSSKGRNKNLRCRGKLRDTVLDWEDPLPEPALKLSEKHCAQADLCLCLGTSLQIRPCRDLPRKTKRNGGRVVIVNLQKTSMDSLASLIIHERCDFVMKYLLDQLKLNVESNPTERCEKVIALVGRPSEIQRSIEDNLIKSINATLIRLNDFAKENSSSDDWLKWKNDQIRDDPSVFCQRILNSNPTNSTLIFSDIENRAELQFLQNQFKEKLILVRMKSKENFDESTSSNSIEFESDSDISWSFTFSCGQTDSIDVQMHEFLSFLTI